MNFSIIYFFSQVKDQLSLKIHEKDSGPNGITSSAEAYIIIHEAHHSPVTCAPGPKIAPIINPWVQYKWGILGPGAQVTGE